MPRLHPPVLLLLTVAVAAMAAIGAWFATDGPAGEDAVGVVLAAALIADWAGHLPGRVAWAQPRARAAGPHARGAARARRVRQREPDARPRQPRRHPRCGRSAAHRRAGAGRRPGAGAQQRRRRRAADADGAQGPRPCRGDRRSLDPGPARRRRGRRDGDDRRLRVQHATAASAPSSGTASSWPRRAARRPSRSISGRGRIRLGARRARRAAGRRRTVSRRHAEGAADAARRRHCVAAALLASNRRTLRRAQRRLRRRAAAARSRPGSGWAAGPAALGVVLAGGHALDAPGWRPPTRRCATSTACRCCGSTCCGPRGARTPWHVACTIRPGALRLSSGHPRRRREGGAAVTAADTTDRIENPHRPAQRPPLLTPHPFRPGTLGAGLALTALGAVFLASAARRALARAGHDHRRHHARRGRPRHRGRDRLVTPQRAERRAPGRRQPV